MKEKAIVDSKNEIDYDNYVLLGILRKELNVWETHNLETRIAFV